MGPTTTTMVCRACDYPLDGLKSSACPECGHPFDRGDPDSFRRVLDHPMDAWTARDHAEALRVRDDLEAQGVPAVIDRRSGMDVFGMGAVWAVCVSAADVRRAAELLKVRSTSEGAKPWTCPACGEQVDAGFALCWQCGTDCAGRPAEDFKPAVASVQDQAQCAQCGYMLRGLTRSECPECGAPFDRDRRDTTVESAQPPDAQVLHMRSVWTGRMLLAWGVTGVGFMMLRHMSSAPPRITALIEGGVFVSMLVATFATFVRVCWGCRQRA